LAHTTHKKRKQDYRGDLLRITVGIPDIFWYTRRQLVCYQPPTADRLGFYYVRQPVPTVTLPNGVFRETDQYTLKTLLYRMQKDHNPKYNNMEDQETFCNPENPLLSTMKRYISIELHGGVCAFEIYTVTPHYEDQAFEDGHVAPKGTPFGWRIVLAPNKLAFRAHGKQISKSNAVGWHFISGK